VSALLAAAAGAAVMMFVAGFSGAGDGLVRQRLGGAGDVATSPGPRFLVALGRRVTVPGIRARVLDRVEAVSGDPEAVDRILGTKVALGFLGGATGMLLGAGGVEGAAVAAALAAGGFAFPGFRLARTVASRRARAAASVPELLDLVSVSVMAGLTPRLALERATEVVSGPIGTELELARSSVALGTPWRDAVRRMADRTGLGELRRLAVTLSRSERLGAPVADRLRSLARDVREERRAAAEERARRAPVTMLFPLVFLILPAFVLAAIVPAIVVATRGVA
jgi:tight adherence protein C